MIVVALNPRVRTEGDRPVSLPFVPGIETLLG